MQLFFLKSFTFLYSKNIFISFSVLWVLFAPVGKCTDSYLCAFFFFSASKPEVCSFSCPIVKSSKLCDWEPDFLFFFLYFLEIVAADKRFHCKEKKAAEIPWAIPLMWSMMWANKLALQFLWNQWNEWCLKWTCSGWLLKKQSCFAVAGVPFWNVCV